MKRILISMLASMLMAARTLAQDAGGAQADMIKERAKQQRDISNQQQGLAPLAPTTQPGPGSYQTPAAATAAPQAGISSSQQMLIDRLETDLRAIKAGVPATAQNKSGLQKDIESLARGAIKPTKVNTTKLADDLADALAGKSVTAKDLAQLAKAVNVVMNCAPVSPPRAQYFVNAAQTVLTASGASEASVKAVGMDLSYIVLEIQKAKPKLYQ